MKVTRVIWLPEIEDKLWRKHRVLPEEAEEAIFGQPWIKFVERGHREEEDLYAVYGQTDVGRYLIVFILFKAGHEALVVSARDMDEKERRSYGRRKG
jgi:uncharacterized protein